MNIIEETGVPIKGVGDGLSAKDVNAINSTLNKEVAVGNNLMRSFCDVNQELGNYTKIFTLETAIANVPIERRSPGMCVRYRGRDERYTEYVFCGESTNDWMNTDLWKLFINKVDGGEW